MEPATQHLQRTLDDAVGNGIPGVVAGVADADGPRWIGAAGVRSLATGEPMQTDTVIALHSATKAFTTTAALQCIEDGLIELDAPARDYLPAIGDLRVLERIDEDDVAHTRPPTRDITVRMLLLHTSGIAYDMFDAQCARLSRARMRTPSATPLWDSLQTPLVHDPGERWTYGMSMDWLGLLVSAVRGERLEDVFRERIFAPCGMTSTSFDMPEPLRDRLSAIHRRRSDGTVTVVPTAPPDRPELDMGGQGLFSTVADILALLRVWLTGGAAPGGRVLQPETIGWAARTVPGLTVTTLPAAIPSVTREVQFFPGTPTSWAYSFAVNDADVPGGRRAGSLSWAGLANIHYWIDRASGLAAVWAAQMMPFFDEDAITSVQDFERAVYVDSWFVD